MGHKAEQTSMECVRAPHSVTPSCDLGCSNTTSSTPWDQQKYRLDFLSLILPDPENQAFVSALTGEQNPKVGSLFQIVNQGQPLKEFI